MLIVLTIVLANYFNTSNIVATMEFILIPSSSKKETAFFKDLCKKMNIDITTLSEEILEEKIFYSLLKKSDKESNGSLTLVKDI